MLVAGQTLTSGGSVTVGGDVLSLAGGAITVVGTVTIGGGVATAYASASPTGKKKNAGGRAECSIPLLGVHVLAMVVGMLVLT